ncbi:GNAT family N-acetyltransferase [Devosia sp. A8/3-2]|nr:GNAT family N-acetyltransferase [Devosia sp. A8/3-2]
MTEFSLRPFQWSDIPTITNIYRHYVENTAITFDTEAPDETTIAEKYAGLKRLGHPVIIAEREGKVLGYAYASFYRPRAAYRFTCEDSIYLDPTATGKGSGKLLLTELLAQSKAFGFKQMLAVITADTANSITIHEKFGFTHVGRYEAVGYKFNRWHDIVHLQLSL